MCVSPDYGASTEDIADTRLGLIWQHWTPQSAMTGTHGAEAVEDVPETGEQNIHTGFE